MRSCLESLLSLAFKLRLSRTILFENRVVFDLPLSRITNSLFAVGLWHHLSVFHGTISYSFNKIR